MAVLRCSACGSGTGKVEGRSKECPFQILDGEHLAYATETAALSKLVACSVCLQARASWRGVASSCWASFWMSTRARQLCATMCASQPSWRPTLGASRPSRCAADAQRVAAWSHSCRHDPHLSLLAADAKAENKGDVWALPPMLLTRTHIFPLHCPATNSGCRPARPA